MIQRTLALTHLCFSPPPTVLYTPPPWREDSIVPPNVWKKGEELVFKLQPKRRRILAKLFFMAVAGAGAYFGKQRYDELEAAKVQPKGKGKGGGGGGAGGGKRR